MKLSGAKFKIALFGGIPLMLIIAFLVWRAVSPKGLRQITGEILGQTPLTNPLTSKITLKLFFESLQTGELALEERQFAVISTQASPQEWLDKVEAEQLQELVFAVLKGLLAGPDTKGLAATLPKGVTVRSVYFDSTGGAYVDFDEQLIRQHPGGTQAEMISIYSVVNTLCLNFPQIKKVKFLIGGKEVQTLAGHVDLTYPLSYRKL